MERLFIFPNQGHFDPNFAKDLSQNKAGAKLIYDEAATILDFDVRDLQDADLDAPHAHLFASFVHALALWNSLPEEVSDRAQVVGFNSGQFTALVAAHALPITDGLRIIQNVVEAVDEHSTEVSGYPVIIRQPDMAQVTQLLEDYAQLVWLTIDNQPEAVLIAGEESAMDAFVRSYEGTEIEAYTDQPALHTILMKDSAMALGETMSELDFVLSPPNTPIINTLDAGHMTALTAHGLTDFVVSHLTEAMRWGDSLRTAQAVGITEFIYLGSPSDLECALTPKLNGVNTTTLSSYQDLVDWLDATPNEDLSGETHDHTA